MKTEDDAAAAPDVHAVAPPPPSDVRSSEAAASDRLQQPSTPGAKRTVCDHCRRRRIRCDGQFPCQQCINAALTCKRDHVPRKRGPKRGHGRVINELRAKDAKERTSRDSSPEYVSPPFIRTVGSGPAAHREDSLDVDGVDPRSSTTSIQSTPPPQDISWWNNASDPRNASEPQSGFTSDNYQPNSRPYLHLIPQCVELYYEHIYPIMPLLYMPAIRSTIARPMTPSEKNLIYALCALTCMHMSGKSLQVAGPPSWETAGRFFLDECISTRQSYDFLEDQSLYAVISSFWLSTSFFEINQNRKSWLYLREALTLALDLGLHDDSTYIGLSPEETLCRQRVFWILFVTERSFAILRNKPITFKKTPSLPTTRHSYEPPDIHIGFLKLISSYHPLDESFVTAWNDGSDPRVSATTYLALQNLLSHPPSFLTSSRFNTPFSQATPTNHSPGSVRPTASASNREADSAADQNEPTSIQKADLLITQQWLRLIVWQSSFRQGLLSWAAPHESMHFAFPLAIARRTASVLQSLPSSAVEVHGMGIFEKIFEIGTWCINVLGAYDSASAAGSPIAPADVSGPGGVMEMDFVTGGDMGVLGLSRKGVAVDPLEFFVRTLSATPNSRTQFAERLLMFAQERPGGMRMALSPALSAPDVGPSASSSGWVAGGAQGLGGAGIWANTGSIIGEVKEEEETNTDRRFEMSGALGPGPGRIVTQAPQAVNFDPGGVEPGINFVNAASFANPQPQAGPSSGPSVPRTLPPSLSVWSSSEIGPGVSFQLNPTVNAQAGTGGPAPALSRYYSEGSVQQGRGLGGGNGAVASQEDEASAARAQYNRQRSAEALQGGRPGDLGVW
ncbi:Fungal specific transcription factor domain-containing protein [Pleurostoma richardsiae]|uniref:Fungal specific transcription factor domain-containing protein n=1 Tax=Pleurostoma richardsiae TaxID=41990 RepID=A0AA38VP03_9PEZI|nr:Fungal specific transcription factor domain-containing protein [Pleurostoma richardsiae]